MNNYLSLLNLKQIVIHDIIYNIVQHIAIGASGQCFLAQTQEDEQRCLKFIEVTNCNSNMIKNEIDIMSKVNHPFIVKYYDSCEQEINDKQYYIIVMEYCQHGTLSSYAKTLNDEQKYGLIIQLIISLHYLHQNKIIHRDVKNDNILIGGDGNIKLADFGCAQSLIQQNNIIKAGTEAYMSPQATMKYQCNEHDDIWAVGVTAYKVQTDKLPFYKTSQLTLTQSIGKGIYDKTPLKGSRLEIIIEDFITNTNQQTKLSDYVKKIYIDIIEQLKDNNDIIQLIFPSNQSL